MRRPADDGGIPQEVVEIPIDGILDLHQFRPADARDVVGDYLDACREKGVFDVRIVHGKGKGVLRRIVHSLLSQRRDVVSFRLAGDYGGWGATRVRLAGAGSSTDADRGATAADGPGGADQSPAGRGGGSHSGGAALIAAALLLTLVAGCSADAPDSAATAPATGTGATAPSAGADAASRDEAPEVYSLDGRPLYRPDLPEERRARLEANLESGRADYEAAPDDEDATIWYGRRLAYLSRYNEAIEVYSRGIERHPEAFRLLRHRGHRYISTRSFADAVVDLRRAATLAQEHPVEIEPDGAPNARNIPLSNGHFNIWYHLGLAYYLQGDFERARDAYLECMKYSDNDDLLVATSDWLYMTYRRLGDDTAAAAVLEPISADLEIIENDAYLRRLLMYKGEVAAQELLGPSDADDPDAALQIATQGYGVGNWHLVNGETEAAYQVFERILDGTSWAAFGYIAAEADLSRRAGR